MVESTIPVPHILHGYAVGMPGRTVNKILFFYDKG